LLSTGRDDVVALPEPMRPAGTYVPVVRVGEIAFVSGQGPIVVETGAMVKGKVGESVSVDEARAAARLAGLNALAALRQELGTLDRVAHVAKLYGVVNAAPGFNRMSEVMEGCSELLVEVFGEAGRHARTSVGASELPFDLCLELDLVVALHPADGV
jgi:enamine deaminase RidA (YjgF/YER057c/UK114 family)